MPTFVDSDINQQILDLHVEAPQCGQTVCDDPRIIESYNRNWELRRQKTVRYRVVNIMQGDGTNSCVTAGQIHSQHVALQEAFRC